MVVSELRKPRPHGAVAAWISAQSDRALYVSAVTRGQRVVALEVKLSRSVDDADVSHLKWLKGELGPALVDMAVVTTGGEAYRRRDQVAVIPAALLGP